MRCSMSNWQDIRVSSEILGHISAGIYRSPGGAIKELISNAFDADATRVVITTNWPSFDIITCRDNGNGIKRDKFEQIMTQEIGNSSKRNPIEVNVNDITNQGRPIIGWLGIGMLGVAQICHEFKLISHCRADRKAFRASIRLGDFRNEENHDILQEQASEQQIDVGQFRIEPIDYDPDKAGTYVIVSDMRSTFVMKFRETLGANPTPLPSRFSEFLKTIHRARSVKSLSDYWQMVWELSVACPIPYKDGGPFNWDKIEAQPELKKQLVELQLELSAYQFEVVVDGLSLRKPNQYPRASFDRERWEQPSGKLFPVSENVTIYGKSLKLSGYIYLQNSRAVEPMELRGLLVRIRNIAIGTYDSTLFEFPQVPSPRFNWLSGEIYIEDGLELALNIDRDSFNEMHPHFVKLKEVIHNLLRDTILPEASRGQRERTQVKYEDRQHEKQTKLEYLIRQELGADYVLVQDDEQQFPLTIDTDQNLVTVNNQSESLPNSKGKRELVQFIAHAFEISMLAPEVERREKFYQMLSEFAKSGLL